MPLKKKTIIIFYSKKRFPCNFLFFQMLISRFQQRENEIFFNIKKISCHIKFGEFNKFFLNFHIFFAIVSYFFQKYLLAISF